LHPHRHARQPRATSNSTSQPALIASAWYTGWHATDFPLEDVSWSKYSHMSYAFAFVVCLHLSEHSFNLLCSYPTPESSIIALGVSDQQLLPEFVATAHKNVNFLHSSMDITLLNALNVGCEG
jgi:chitinase